MSKWGRDDMADQAQTRTGTPGGGFTITGFILAVVALFLVPILFGPQAQSSAASATAKGAARGWGHLRADTR